MSKVNKTSADMVTAFQERRHNQLLEAHEYLQEGKAIPDWLLAELGITGRRIVSDSPDLDTLSADYRSHVEFIHNYKMLIDEIRMTCLA